MDVNEQIDKFKEVLEGTYQKDLYEVVQQGKRSLLIDFPEIQDVDLREHLLENPEELVKSAELALEQVDLPEESQYKIRIRFRNLPPSQQIRVADIRSEHLGRFVWLEGIVRQTSDVRPQVTKAKFECAGCNNTLSILQIDSKFKEPTRCTCGWRGKFRLLDKELIDVQHVKIEEAPENLYGAEQPKRLSIILSEDLVDPKMERKVVAGNKVRIYGVIKEIPIPLKTGAQSTRYDIILEGNNVETVHDDYADIKINADDEAKIKEIGKDPNVFEKFVKSVAPSIYGHEKVKEALILQLMGGVRKVKEDGTITRGDIHILLVGDPGAGKSQMLQFVARAAPKARFVSGKGASGAGLTATVVKDEFLRGWALEAGALVLANKGIAVVDELDKMTDEDRAALHEALEQQTVTISKANVQATLSAQTTMLSAANPKLGRFDPYSPIAAQIDLPASLINRFDLIFPIRDIPNKEKDERIAIHVLDSTQKKEIYQTEITPDFLRKYLAYVKQNIFPTMTQAAITVIKDFYVNLRNSGRADESGVKPIPISARQLEALIRLSEASAKIRLSDKVTRDDALRAITLLKSCLMEVGFDPETGQIDIDRMGSGITASARSKIISIKEIILNIESKGIKTIPIEQIIADAAVKGVEESKVYESIEQLKKSGDLFEPKKGFIQRIG